MSDFDSSKTLAGIGSILLMIPLAGIVGVILIYLSMKNFAEYYKDNSIRQNMLTGAIFWIIGIIMSGIGILFGLTIIGILIAIPLFIVAAVFELLMVIYVRRALHVLADRSGVNLFRTAGTLLLVGAILTIFVIGAFFMFIAYILLAVAFFSLKPNTNPPTYNNCSAPSPPPQTTSTASTDTKFCTHCGAPVPIDSAFCSRCGKQA
ncbi:DUF996 domain-containing protein [Candidatus Bathycorpusculum sp.]|uniref:DUF996 domain-containing protein n=1 Tax=Candidatus Bathycorpusculum sp. TaxID=2994959 RepID=UPI0028284C9A|nr:DUF996 domain-containing protein [Candidatus Termitimicrobium sp.]MCL2684980.1 DUF996 domain-containing protein [Candidatus Termitimicrobium sp.]